jgi:vacuolar-type H+-ATPase subunit H
MKQVIAEILEAEKQARQEVEEAKVKAKAIRLKAEEDAKSLAASIRDKARKEAQERIARAETEALEQKEKELAKAGRESGTLWKDKEKEIAKSVDALFKTVLGGESR